MAEERRHASAVVADRECPDPDLTSNTGSKVWKGKGGGQATRRKQFTPEKDHRIVLRQAAIELAQSKCVGGVRRGLSISEQSC